MTLIMFNKVKKLLGLLFFCILSFSLSHSVLDAQTTGTGAPGLRIDVSGSNDEGDFGVAIQLVVAMTILTLGPSNNNDDDLLYKNGDCTWFC